MSGRAVRRPIPDRRRASASSKAGVRAANAMLSCGQACTQSRHKVQSRLPTLAGRKRPSSQPRCTRRAGTATSWRPRTQSAVPHVPHVPGSRIWTLGHRNVQGLAWDKTGAMYASELGQNTWDELNLIVRGRNYGWPIVEGIGHRPGLVDPLRQWTTAEASPSGIAVGDDGAIYMAALRGESLWRIPLNGPGRTGTPQRLLQQRYGRLRTVVSAPDGRLWLVTNNTFRGDPRPGDDQIVALRLPVQG